ncbi:MAG: hypothetical protein R3C31_03855 [Hyphomonadaceae bacterium]
MSIFPKIQGPCPYKSELSKYMDGDLCRLCDRRVVDLNPLSSAERVALISGCKEKICVSYNLRPAVAAALTVAAIGTPLSAAAQDASMDEVEIIVGTIIEPNTVEYVSEPVALIELPVIYDDEQTPASDEAAALPASETPKPQTEDE